jgi:hypothetical protein
MVMEGEDVDVFCREPGCALYRVSGVDQEMLRSVDDEYDMQVCAA